MLLLELILFFIFTFRNAAVRKFEIPYVTLTCGLQYLFISPGWKHPSTPYCICIPLLFTWGFYKESFKRETHTLTFAYQDMPLAVKKESVSTALE